MNITKCNLLVLAVLQSVMLTGGQVMLKIALKQMLPFGWTWTFWKALLLNWPFAVCGMLFGTASLLWMYIIKHFPFSQAYPMASLSYVFGMLAAMVFFHESVDYTKWIGVLLIMLGCFLIAK